MKGVILRIDSKR